MKSIIYNLNKEQRKARTATFKWLAREFKRNNVSKNLRRLICLKIDLEIYFRYIEVYDNQGILKYYYQENENSITVMDVDSLKRIENI